MPTFSAIAFERLIEPGLSTSSNKSAGDSNYGKSETQSSDRKSEEKKFNRIQITPALYATPEATPIPDSPTSYTPSPYIVNHKRRGPRLAVNSSKIESKSEKKDDAGCDNVVKAEQPTQNGESAEVNSICQKEEDDDDFFDPQETMSSASSSSVRASEFYDAWDELSNDGSYQMSSKRDYEAELSAMKMSVEEEHEKRKQAEEALSKMVNQWRNMKEKLALAGISINDSEPEKDICEQFDVARFVAQAIGQAMVKSEMGIELEAQISKKNTEIARLLDRVRYYEAINREMCEWNQEELRRKKAARRQQQRWMWGSIVAAIAVGGAGLAWSYIGSSESAQRDSLKEE